MNQMAKEFRKYDSNHDEELRDLETFLQARQEYPQKPPELHSQAPWHNVAGGHLVRLTPLSHGIYASLLSAHRRIEVCTNEQADKLSLQEPTYHPRQEFSPELSSGHHRRSRKPSLKHGANRTSYFLLEIRDTGDYGIGKRIRRLKKK